MDIAPVRTTYLVDEVVERLAEMIGSGQLPAQTPLPPEHELAKRLDVSRTVAREALQRLRSIGLVASNRRGGTRVQQPSLEKLFS